MCRKPATKSINLFNWHVTANVIGVVNLSLKASIYSTDMSHSYNCHKNCHTLVCQHWNTAVATVTQLSQLPHLTCLIMINNFVLDVRRYCQDFMCMTHWLFFHWLVWSVKLVNLAIEQCNVGYGLETASKTCFHDQSGNNNIWRTFSVKWKLIRLVHYEF